MAHLFVIAGHGHGDSGAVGNGFTEAERVRALAARIGELGGGNVTLGDMSRDYYVDNGISRLNIPKDWAIIELHMDSGASSARGGHVIICSGLKADKYDNALASFIAGILPGRSSRIVARNNLANPKRAKAKGYNYRLLECGFISNAGDVSIFNNRMDDIARGILASFGIGASGSTSAPTPAQKPIQKPATESTKNTGFNFNDWVGRLQAECNRQGFSKQKVDKIPGKNTLAGCPTLNPGSSGNITKLWQEYLIANGYSCGKYGADGKNGADTQAATKAYQRDHGLDDDKVVGKNTWSKALHLS